MFKRYNTNLIKMKYCPINLIRNRVTKSVIRNKFVVSSSKKLDSTEKKIFDDNKEKNTMKKYLKLML
jgi:hypothetical protein